jgi:hypothetical protein
MWLLPVWVLADAVATKAWIVVMTGTKIAAAVVVMGAADAHGCRGVLSVAGLSARQQVPGTIAVNTCAGSAVIRGYVELAAACSAVRCD